MTPFNIQWTFVRVPDWPSEKIQLVKKLYFEAAGRRWGYVLKGWPDRLDGQPLRLPGSRPLRSIEIQVNFEYFRRDVKSAVARVPEATMQYLNGSANQPWNFPFLAALNIDLSDLDLLMQDRARFFDTIVHEVGHVLGIGTRWDDGVPVPPLLYKSASPPSYVGPNACQAYAELKNIAGSSGSLPRIPLDVEQAGTTSAYHWSEKDLPFEIMSSTLDMPSVATGSNVISKISVGALKDLGYLVEMGAAESWPVLQSAARSAPAAPAPAASVRPGTVESVEPASSAALVN